MIIRTALWGFLVAASIPPTWSLALPLQDQSAKQDMKDAGRSTEHAAKKTGRSVKRKTKRGVNKSAHSVRKGAGKVEEKTD
jgi:hypothetical protein